METVWTERTSLLLGEEKMKRLHEAHVLVVGVGGVGAYAAEMGGVDIIVFTGGVGENQLITRENICRQLEYLGVTFDAEANNCRGKEVVISGADSKVKVVVIPTDEELMIAQDTAAIVAGK